MPPELQLDLIEAAEKRETPAIKQKLARYHARKQKLGPLAEYDDLLFGGNAAQGRRIFFDRPDAQCVRCHKANGQGGDVGPDLSHVAAQKERSFLLESIVFPNNQIAPGFESAIVTLKNDEVVAGVVKSETATELVLNSPQTGIMRINKTDIASRNKALSPMPEGLAKILSREDLRNLVEFLGGLK